MEHDAPLDPDTLIACPVCDMLHRDADIPVGNQARCKRCHHVLMTPRYHAMTRIMMLCATSLVLMAAAVFFPFLDISTAGLEQQSSVVDAILAFSTGWLMPLSFAVAAFIVILPTLRLTAVLYTVGPMAIGYAPWPGARRAFRLAETLQPWSMSEIFVVGVAVALVKIGGLATLTIGPAFWAFAALVIVTALKDTFMCKVSIWKTLDHRSPR